MYIGEPICQEDLGSEEQQFRLSNIPNQEEEGRFNIIIIIFPNHHGIICVSRKIHISPAVNVDCTTILENVQHMEQPATDAIFKVILLACVILSLIITTEKTRRKPLHKFLETDQE